MRIHPWRLSVGVGDQRALLVRFWGLGPLQSAPPLSPDCGRGRSSADPLPIVRELSLAERRGLLLPPPLPEGLAGTVDQKTVPCGVLCFAMHEAHK